MNLYKIGAILGLATLALTANAQSFYSTGFENMNLGNVSGQDGWSINGNANHQGIVQSNIVHNGFQALELRTLDDQTTQDNNQGVIHGLRSSTVDKAGESVTVNGPSVNNSFRSSFWFRTPDAQLPVNTGGAFEDPYGGILELNPSFSQSGGGARYASLTLYDASQDQMGYYTGNEGLLLELSTPNDYDNNANWEFDILQQNMSYGTWYRLQFDVLFVDGTNGDETPNDVLKVSIFDSSNAWMSTVINSTWESPFRSAFGNGPMSVDSMGFRGLRQTAGLNLGYVDDFQVESVPEPATMTILALGALAALKKRKSK